MAKNLNEVGGIRVADETETRQKFYQYAKAQGAECLYQYVEMMKKYDRLISACSNERERDDLCALASMEITELLFGDHETQLIV